MTRRGLKAALEAADNGRVSCLLPIPVASPLPARVAGARARGEVIGQGLLLVVLLVAPALVGLHAAVVGDPDVWWHLRSGEWIVAHRAVPHADLFSRGGVGRPWAAYSWLFEVLVFGLFRQFGLGGIPLYTAGALLAITVACQHMIRRLQADVSAGVLLAAAVCFSCSHLYTPRPWLLSILLFVLEMDVLMQARRTGRRRELAWLPVIFVLWANVHIQFVDGLAVLGLAWAESAVAWWWRGGVRTELDLRFATAAVVASVAATLCNPYGWHLYRVAFELASQPGVLDKVQELRGVPFRDLADWSVLGLGMGAVAVLARSGRVLSFEAAVLALAMFLGLRSQRDVWILAVSAAAILAGAAPAVRETGARRPLWLTPVAAAVAASVLWGYSRGNGLDDAHLAARLREAVPVRAVDFVKAKGYSGPVYNDYAWGGYLIWALRQPVSLDGRAAFYGDRRLDRSIATWNGAPDWDWDAELRGARLVIGPVQAPLTQLLKRDAGMELVYEDGLAAVFVRRGR